MSKRYLNDLFGRKSILNCEPDANWPVANELIGIEIEVENFRGDYNKVYPIWTTHSDGSLRNGVEFVLSAPLAGKSLSEAIDMFFDAGFKYDINERTSIHIHINASDNMDIDQFRALFVLMYLIEPAVFRWADENRKWCGYCAPLTDMAPARLLPFLVDTGDARFVNAVRGNGNSDRYFGYNMAAYTRHGTVEFRYFPCTNDKQAMIDWVKFVMLAKRAARRAGSPSQITEVFSSRRNIPDWFVQEFGDIGFKLLSRLDLDETVARAKTLSMLINISPDCIARDFDSTSFIILSAGGTAFVNRKFPEQVKKRPSRRTKKVPPVISGDELLDLLNNNGWTNISRNSP